MEGGSELFARGREAVAALAQKVRRRIHEAVGLTAEVAILPPKSIERSVGKAVRVLDQRPKA